MTGWKQDSEKLDEFVGQVVRVGWLLLPAKCPCCSTLESVHLYFDTDPIGGFGSYWIWCSSCRRFEHGSLRPPGWWQNLGIIPRPSLASEPDAVQAFVNEIDRHWIMLGRGAENDLNDVRRHRNPEEPERE
jgi:hypothetical protein